MKSIWTSFLLGMIVAPVLSNQSYPSATQHHLPKAENLVIVTIDGFRWQELFGGADSAILFNEKYTPDASTIALQFWETDPVSRRNKLMPFFWNVIGSQGQVFGNRNAGNQVNVANLYALSYPGYNEMFTGTTDYSISSNRKRNNPNINIFEHLNSLPAFHDKVAVFSFWDVFPYILNTRRNNLPVNGGYADTDSVTDRQQLLNRVQRESINEKEPTRNDQLTFVAAKEYLQLNRPRVFCLGLGETDEHAHNGRYDLYLQQAAQTDRLLADLWHFIQTTPGYKNNTTMLITTDHGRGNRPSTWSSHGEFINGSGQGWVALIGPGIAPAGEIKTSTRQYVQQLAATFAGLVGEDFPQAEAPALTLAGR